MNALQKNTIHFIRTLTTVWSRVRLTLVIKNAVGGQAARDVPRPTCTVSRASLGIALCLSLGVSALHGSGCRKPPAPATPEEPQSPADPKPIEDATHDELSLQRLKVELEAVTESGWLSVVQIRGDAAGAWASGAFDEEHNKLVIRTQDVQRFAVDVTRIPIDWKKIVIVRIDDRNSEMRRRKQTFYHFSLDAHGKWVVLEP